MLFDLVDHCQIICAISATNAGESLALIHTESYFNERCVLTKCAMIIATIHAGFLSFSDSLQ